MKLDKEHPKNSHTETFKRQGGTHDSRGNGAGAGDWFESLEPALEYVLKNQDPDKTARFLDKLVVRLRDAGVRIPHVVSTPYINTIPVDRQAPFPGDWETEVRIKSYPTEEYLGLIFAYLGEEEAPPLPRRRLHRPHRRPEWVYRSGGRDRRWPSLGPEQCARVHHQRRFSAAASVPHRDWARPEIRSHRNRRRSKNLASR